MNKKETIRLLEAVLTNIKESPDQVLSGDEKAGEATLRRETDTHDLRSTTFSWQDSNRNIAVECVSTGVDRTGHPVRVEQVDVLNFDFGPLTNNYTVIFDRKGKLVLGTADPTVTLQSLTKLNRILTGEKRKMREGTITAIVK